MFCSCCCYLRVHGSKQKTSGSFDITACYNYSIATLARWQRSLVKPGAQLVLRLKHLTRCSQHGPMVQNVLQGFSMQYATNPSKSRCESNHTRRRAFQTTHLLGKGVDALLNQSSQESKTTVGVGSIPGYNNGRIYNTLGKG